MKEERILYSDSIPTLDKFGTLESLKFRLNEQFDAVYVHGAFFGYFVFRSGIWNDKIEKRTREEIEKRVALHYGCKPLSIHLDPVRFIVVDKGVIGACET